MKAVRKIESSKDSSSSLKSSSDIDVNLSNNRKPSVPSSPPTTIELRGIPIHFPFKPYKCQEDYMAKVLDALNHSENALLESPTGTGKTLCLLCATLSWQREQARSLKRKYTQQQLTQQVVQQVSTDGPKEVSRLPTIIYASRTHSQLSQVVRELKNTRYRPRHALLGSREQMCVNQKVKTSRSTVADINHMCNKLGKDRKCLFRNTLDQGGFRPEPNEPGAHPNIQPVMDMEDLVTMGKTRKVCPFYYTRSLVDDAELILVPYNYLFDKDARETTLQDIPWNNSVVIFDEAHNLESFASDSASFDLSSVDVAGCIVEVQRVIEYQQNGVLENDRLSPDNLVRLKAIFKAFEEYIVKIIPNDRNVFTGEYMMKIFNEGARITHENHVMFVNEAKKVSDAIMDMRGNGGTKGQTRLDFFVSCVKRVFGESTEGLCLAKARSYRVHVSSKTGTGAATSRIISYWCFAPSLAMQELSNLNIRSILVTSGTLSPLPSYSLELGLSFPHTLENPHIISDEQIHVRVIGRGVGGKLLSSQYNRREDSEYISELGCTIVNLARVVPAGMLVFFPSYGVMENCVGGWGGPCSRRGNYKDNGPQQHAIFSARRKHQSNKPHSGQNSFPHAPNFFGSSQQQPIWKRLLAQKAIVLEPKSTSDLADAIADFHKYLNLPKSSGCILMGVCRGKISEGIDFSHDMCRAVVITGLPFAPFLDPKVKLKREYLDGVRAGHNLKPSGDGGFAGDSSHGLSHQTPITLSGMEWYQQQAHRAVNQAVGRVIRNKYDYGAVLLLDSRFGEPRNIEGLSRWVRTRVLPDETFGVAINSLGQFYRRAKIKELELDAERRAFAAPPLTPSPAVLLAYEEDLPNDQSEIRPAKVAVVKPPLDMVDINGEGATQDADEGRGYIHHDQIIAISTTGVQSGKEKAARNPIVTNGNMMGGTQVSRGLEDIYRSSKSSSRSSSNLARNDTVELQTLTGKLVPSKQSIPDGSGEADLSTRSAAQVFFDAAKNTLTSADLISFRKLLVAMKKHGDKKETEPYMDVAGLLIDILLRYDTIENQGATEQRLSKLFFPLLPAVYQQEIQELMLKKQLQKSTFMIYCREKVPKELRGKFCTLVFRALKGFFLVAPGTSVSRNDTIRLCSPVVEFFYRNGLHVAESTSARNADKRPLLSSFCDLLPAGLRSIPDKLINDVETAEALKRVKVKEKAKEGENSVETVRFSAAIRVEHESGEIGKQKSESLEEIENERTMKAALIEAKQIMTQKRDRVKAEIERRNINAENPNLSRVARPAKKPFKPSLTSINLSGNPFDRSKAGKMLIKEDRVAQILLYAKSAPVERGMSKTRIPENLIATECRICDKSCKEPLMAECGHVACGTCWSQWLAKSSSCPLCRQQASKDSLARVVYDNNHSSEIPPSHPQPLNPPKLGDSAESDDELEVIVE